MDVRSKLKDFTAREGMKTWKVNAQLTLFQCSSITPLQIKVNLVA